MMKCFAIDGTRQGLSLALAVDEKLQWHRTYDLGKKTSRILLPALEEARRQAGLTWEELDLLASTAGPGSFTGIRISLMTAKTMAYASKKPLGCFSNLELYYRALAFSWLQDNQEGTAAYKPHEIWSSRSDLLAPPPEQIFPLILLEAGNDRAYSFAPSCPQPDLAPEGVHHLLTWAYYLETWHKAHPQAKILLAGDLGASYRLGALATEHLLFFPYHYEDALYTASVPSLAGAAALAALASYQADPKAPFFQEAHPVYLAPTQAERLSRQDKKEERFLLWVGAGLQESYALASLYEAFPSRELAQDRPKSTPAYPWRAKHNLWLPLEESVSLPSETALGPNESDTALAPNELEAFVLSGNQVVSACRGVLPDPSSFQIQTLQTQEPMRQQGLAGSLWQKVGNFLLNFLPVEKLTLTLARSAYPALDFFFNRAFTVDQSQNLPPGDQLNLQGDL